MKSKLYCKILAVGIVILFMGVSVSSALSINNKLIPIKIDNIDIDDSSYYKKEVKSLDESNPTPTGGRYGNLIIDAEHTMWLAVLCIILDREPTWLVYVDIINDYDIPITLHKNITLISKRDNKELYTAKFPSNRMEPWTITKLMCLTQYNFQEFKCSFGFIDIVLNVYVEEDGYEASIVFHGFVYGIGVLYFNRNGELLD